MLLHCCRRININARSRICAVTPAQLLMFGHAAMLLSSRCYWCVSIAIDVPTFYYYWHAAMLLGLGLLLIDTTAMFLLLLMHGHDATLLQKNYYWCTAMQLHYYSYACIATRPCCYVDAVMMRLLCFYYCWCMAFLLLLTHGHAARFRVTIDRCYYYVSAVAHARPCCWG